MKKTSFAVYILKHAKRTDDPAGDFIEDAQWCLNNEVEGRPLFPKTLRKFAPSDAGVGPGWGSVEFYLLSRHACSEAIAAAREVFKDYTAWRAAP